MTSKTSKDLNDGYVMMDGSTSFKSYMVFARRGAYALGVQAGGYNTLNGHPDILGFVTRLRCAAVAEKLFADEDKANPVVKFGDKNVELVDAFDFDYDKKREKYCSTNLTYYHKIDPKGGPKAIADAISTGEISRALAKFLATRCEGHLIISEVQIAEWFGRHFTRLSDAINKQLLREQATSEVLADHIGLAMTGVEFKKKVQAKLPSEPVEDADNIEDEDASDE